VAVQRQPGEDPFQVKGKQWRGLSGELAFDVGANCGQSVHEMLPRFKQVVAFEPATESFEVLRHKFRVSRRVTLVGEAVSDHDGEVTLLAIPREMEMGQLVTWVRYDHDGSPSRVLPCRTLDSLSAVYGVPDLVKVDTEGHEAAVLRGATALLRRCLTNWLIEFHNEQLHDECAEVLRNSGHAIETIRHPHYEEGTENWLGHGWLRGLGRSYAFE
jgi:FkbM family methyltransferase